MIEKPFQIEDLVGKRIAISPRSLINRKRLFTTQSWVNIEKLKNAMVGIPDLEVEPPKGWVSMEKQGLIYIIGDGNHRVGLACLEDSQIPFVVEGIWRGGEKYGFNIIISKINSELRGSIGGDD